MGYLKIFLGDEFINFLSLRPELLERPGQEEVKAQCV